MSFDPTKLIEGVAIALLGATGSEDEWAELTPEEQQDLLLAAHAAVEAHDKWLGGAGFKIVPPGMTYVPASDEEAAAMLYAVKSYHDKKGRKGKLITPDKPKLIIPKASIN